MTMPSNGTSVMHPAPKQQTSAPAQPVTAPRLDSKVLESFMVEEETRSALVEKLLGKKLAVTGKGELVAMILAQYSAIDALMVQLATVDPCHPLVVGLVPKQTGLNRLKLIFQRIKSILK